MPITKNEFLKALREAASIVTGSGALVVGHARLATGAIDLVFHG